MHIKRNFFPSVIKFFTSFSAIIYYLMKNPFEENRQDLTSKKFQNPNKDKRSLELTLNRAKNQKKERDCDDEFEPQYHTMKKLKMPINRARLRQGNWTLQENKIYLKFLSANPQFFTSQVNRRENRVFCRLSELLNKKRTPDQCRSHHQKLLEPLNGCLNSLILKLQRKISSMQEKILQKPAKKSIQKIGLGSEGGEERKQSLQQNSKLGIWQSGIPASKLNGREVRQTIQQDFFRMTLFKNCSTILIEINTGCIQSY